MRNVRRFVALGLMVGSLFMVGCADTNDVGEIIGGGALDIASELPLSEKASSEIKGRQDGMMWAKRESFTAIDTVARFIDAEKQETLIAKDYFAAMLEYVSFNGMDDSESLEQLLEMYEYFKVNPEELNNY